MSLLLLLLDEITGGGIITINPLELQTFIDNDSENLILRNDKIRRVTGFNVTYTLNNRGIARCETVDQVYDATGGYRAKIEQRMFLKKLDDTPIFTGRITNTNEKAVESDSNVGVAVEVDGVDYSEVINDVFFEGTFGSDPKPILTVIAGNPGRILTVEPHGFTSGSKVTIEGVLSTTPVINGDHVITVVNPSEFTIPVNITSPGGGGTARIRCHLREIVSTIFNEQLAPLGIIMAPMELGPLIEKTVFDGTVGDALSHLTKVSGWPYRFLPNYNFEMFEAGTKDAGFVLNRSDVIAGPTRIAQSRAKFANRVYLKYGSKALVD